MLSLHLAKRSWSPEEAGSLVFEKWQMKISDQPLKYCLRADITSSESLSSALKMPSM